ncbi:MAG: hypothetical protein HZA31_02370 [Opitutae bacterium]|nr:hypothetical protein [Opitutae bacterium]
MAAVARGAEPATPAAPRAPCRIEVVETGSGWPVPLVELRTTHQVRFVTDNAGVIAFDLPELMGVETWFDIRGDGYERPKDGFGYRGVRLRPEPGATLRVEVTRTSIAKRLGRITGGGRFGESQRTGRDLAERETGVLGADTVQNAVHNGRMFWAWGDTILPHYPLGIFHATGATTAVRPLETFTPPLRLQLDYFTDRDHRPRAIAKMPGEGPTWLTGCASLPARDGRARLVSTYHKVKGWLDVYEAGLCVWNEATESFEPFRVIWSRSEKTPKPPPLPEGHTVRWRDAAGKEWILFGNPLPTLRCPATFEAWQDPATWEKLVPQETIAVAASPTARVKPHGGAIAWSAYLRRWVAVFTEFAGKTSSLGEIWYAEADTPTGPWGSAVKVLSHENYTFYNPAWHPEFTPEDSPVLLFEGTHTREFANRPAPTPRHDYNQVLYRLDLDDPALHPAAKAAVTPTP